MCIKENKYNSGYKEKLKVSKGIQKGAREVLYLDRASLKICNFSNSEKWGRCGYTGKRWENFPDENNGIKKLSKGKLSTNVGSVL